MSQTLLILMDAETVKSNKNSTIMAQAQPAVPEIAPNEQLIESSEHKPLLKIDQTRGITGARHILLPVDDTEVRFQQNPFYTSKKIFSSSQFTALFLLSLQDSELALHWAIENLYRSGDILHLLHVIPEPKMVHIWAGIYIPPDEDAELVEIEDTKEFVKHRFLQTLITAKVPFQLHIILGPTDSEAVAKVISKKVEDLKAETVVMAKHSKGKLKEYWLGSVTKELIKRVKIPVAVVPPFVK